jgi:hypothetical protein
MNAADGRRISISLDRLGEEDSILGVDVPVTATSYTIPAGTLQGGGQYRVEIQFETVCGGLEEGNDKDKTLILQYNTLPSILASSVRMLPGGQFQFEASSLPGTVLEVQASTNLTHWQDIGRVTNTTGFVWFTDTSPTPERRFFRLRLVE